MDKIICIVGESGSGKSTITELLEKEGYKYIQSFTTRKPRYKNERGHIFTSIKQYECNKANNSIIAETYFDGNYYWTTKGQFNGTCIYVVDVAGVKDLKEKVKDAEIVVIYLKVEITERVYRMYKREGYQIFDIIPREIVQKVKERVIHDKKAFEIIPCDYVVEANRDIKEVLEDIRNII